MDLPGSSDVAHASPLATDRSTPTPLAFFGLRHRLQQALVPQTEPGEVRLLLAFLDEPVEKTERPSGND